MVGVDKEVSTPAHAVAYGGAFLCFLFLLVVVIVVEDKSSSRLAGVLPQYLYPFVEKVTCCV